MPKLKKIRPPHAISWSVALAELRNISFSLDSMFLGSTFIQVSSIEKIQKKQPIIGPEEIPTLGINLRLINFDNHSIFKIFK